MPQEFLERMQTILKDEYPQFLESYQESPSRAIHVNTQKVTVEQFLKYSFFPVQKLSFTPNGFVHQEEKIGNHIGHHLGLFYAQEPSAMIPVSSLSFRKDWKVLDLCASPGGKTSQIASQVTEGFVVSNEVNYGRAKKLLSNIERMGYSNVIVTSETVDALCEVYPNYFDVVLIDAPCSGEGMFRKDIVAQKEWSSKKVTDLATVQKYLLKKASQMVTKDGYLIYSTCTFSLEENEQVIADFLENYDFEVIPVLESILPVTKGGMLEGTRRCYPHIMGEGQFVAILRKTSGTGGNVKNILCPLDLKEQKEIKMLLQDSYHNDFYFYRYKNKIVIAPSPNLEVPDLACLSCFVTAGEFIKGRFIPHHQFVRTYGHMFQNQYVVEWNDPHIMAYLKGQEINISFPKGYGVFMVKEYPLGLFKSTGDILKNHYPKGLRLKF